MKVASFTGVNSCILTAHVPYITTSVLVVDLPPKHRNYVFFSAIVLLCWRKTENSCMHILYIME